MVRCSITLIGNYVKRDDRQGHLRPHLHAPRAAGFITSTNINIIIVCIDQKRDSDQSILDPRRNLQFSTGQ